jgi:hypothetical protein
MSSIALDIFFASVSSFPSTENGASEPKRMRQFPPLDHYDYGDLDAQCICMVCLEWRTQLSRLQSLQERITHHGKACKCALCTQAMKARSAYLAALNRRDLYCESSWHASEMLPRLGEHFMQWLGGQLADRRARDDRWWENWAPHLPIAYWQRCWRNSVLGLGDDVQAAEQDMFANLPMMANATLAAMQLAASSGMAASGGLNPV